MTRSAEAALLGAAVVIAAMGVALVNFSTGQWLDAQVALTLLVFGGSYGTIHVAIRRWAPTASPFLFPLAAFLTAIGFAEIYRLDPRLASIQRWSLMVAAGAAAGLLYVLRDDGVAMLRRYRYLFLTAAVLLLLLPLLPSSWPIRGAEVNGSRLWVRIAAPGRTVSFQPGEFAKVSSSPCSWRPTSLSGMWQWPLFAEKSCASASPNRGSSGPSFWLRRRASSCSSISGTWARRSSFSFLFVGMIYLATGRAAYLVSGAVLGTVGGVVAYRLFDHLQRRITSWLHPFDDFAGGGYQIIQGLFALGSGSLTGAGLGNGRPDLIPAAETDFIFVAIAEELGFGGSVALITAFALFVALGFGIALRARDVFHKILAAGLTLVVGIQAILILAGVLRLMPVTGITLPFVSYGGSSLIANMLVLALLARVSHEVRT